MLSFKLNVSGEAGCGCAGGQIRARCSS